MRKFLIVLIVALVAAGIYQLGYKSGKTLAVSNNERDAAAAASQGEPPVRMERAKSRGSDRGTTRGGSDSGGGPIGSIRAGELPREAATVLQAIERGGPYDYSRDGITFQNRERLLPQREKGYYREFTVRTPGENDRGARRIITGGKPPSEYYWTDDHYRSFSRISDLP